MKKGFSFIALALLSSSMLIGMFSSCQNQVKNKTFALDKYKIWNTSIQAKTTVKPSSKNKKLELHAENCEAYSYVCKIGDKEYKGETKDGSVSMDIPDIPTVETPFKITLSSPGFNNYEELQGTIKREVPIVTDLIVSFKGEEDTDQPVSNGQKFYTTKSKGTVKVMTTDSEISSVVVKTNANSKPVDLTNKTSATTEIDTNTDVEVTVTVKFIYFEDATINFSVKKYANKNAFPIRVLKAKILSGDDDSTEKNLEFDANNKASVEISDVRYSAVKLEMEFDRKLSSYEIKEFKDARPNPYSVGEGVNIPQEPVSGTVSGYLVAEMNNGVEQKLTPINDKKYTEILIVGFGSVSYKIEFKGDNNTSETYTIEIRKSTSQFMKKLGPVIVYNGLSGTHPFGVFRRNLPNTFLLPFFNKGHIFKKEGGFNLAGFQDLAYMGNLALAFVHVHDQPFYLYYNIYDENGDKHQFKRMKANVEQDTKNNTIAIVKFLTKDDDLNNKYFDAFLSSKDTYPNPMFPDYYGKKWRRTSTKHPWLIQLENPKQFELKGTVYASSYFFNLTYNYRIQAMAYDKQHKTASNNEYLTIAKSFGFSDWETGKNIDGWTQFLTGSDNDTYKDTFYLTPAFKDKNIIKEVKYKIQKADSTGNNFTDETDHKDKTITKTEKDNETRYVIGNNGTSQYKFVDGNVYKVEVTVTYNPNGSSTSEESETFKYILDYKNRKTLEPMSAEYDESFSLFDLPISEIDTQHYTAF
ncbi:MAG: hypothetical protein ACTTKH_02705 [Treponema sp.]